MKRKLFCIALVVVMIALTTIPSLPPVQAAVSEDDLRSTIISQYDALAASINQSKIDELAIRQLLSHALNGNGKHLSLGINDALTGSMFNSNTFRASMIDALTKGTNYLQREMLTKCLLGTGVSWHDYSCRYGVSCYEYNDTKDIKDDKSKVSLQKGADYTGALNSNDKAMILIVGTTSSRVWIRQKQVTAEEITYQVQLYVQDEFDFDTNYDKADDKGYDTTLSRLISTVGRLLKYGLLDTYTWEVNVEFDITVPNSCSHEASSYRWEFQGSDLVSVVKDGTVANELTRIQTQKSDGSWKNPYYQTASTVHLMHDMPWVVEFRMKGSNFCLSAGSTYSASERPFLMKTSKYLVGVEYYTYMQYDEEKGKEVKKGARDQYGFEYTTLGYKSNVMHTYRLENRIAADGTNMVYLLIDGEELGAMVNYSVYKNSKYTNHEQQVDWFNGKDILVNYIFNSSVGMASSVVLEYVQIWERGDSAVDLDFVNSSVTNPTCTQPGYTTCVCKLCGASFTKNPVSARGHNYASAVTQPTCTEQGYTTYTCNDCGDSYTDSYQSALGHSYGPWNEVKAPSCTEAGQQYRECAQCGYREDHSIAEKGHSLVQHEGKPASCTESGWQAYETCNDCEYSTYTEIPALGHHHDAVTTAATCTEDGYTTYTCACGDTYTEVIAATGHQYNAVVTAPTCTESGYTTHTCGNCGDTYTADAVAATGHHYETVTVDPSCTAEGSMTHTCHCGETYTEVIAMIPHSYVEGKCEHCGALSVALGDVNGDGNVNVRDARLLLRYVTALTEENELVLLAAADVNGDGRVNVRDARAILIYVVGLA